MREHGDGGAGVRGDCLVRGGDAGAGGGGEMGGVGGVEEVGKR